MSAINEVGKTYERPWGWYKTLDIGEGYQVKIFKVNPGGKLSLQKHYKRSEHWTVISGSPTITTGGLVKEYRVNESLFIPVEVKHRLENNTDKPVMISEVQIGSYVGEDDIRRYDDIYQRD